MLETDTFKLHCFQTLTGTLRPRAPGAALLCQGSAFLTLLLLWLQGSNSWFLLTRGRQG